MIKEQILKELRVIFCDVFDDPNLQVAEHTASKDIAEWDSLKHIILISIVEKHFNVKFALGEIESLKNVGGMLSLIGDKL